MVDVKATLLPIAARDTKPGQAVTLRATGQAVLSHRAQVVYATGVYAADNEFRLAEALDVPDAADVEHGGCRVLWVHAHVEEADGAVAPACEEARMGRRRIRGQAVGCKNICAQVCYSPSRARLTVSLSKCDALFQAVEYGLFFGRVGH